MQAEEKEWNQPVDFAFVHPPFEHQAKEFDDHRTDALRAVFWEQGTGKSKLIIDTLAWMFTTDCVDGFLVVAPDGVHRNWTIDEIPEHLPPELLKRTRSHAFETKKAGTKWHQRALKELVRHEGLAVLAMSYDAFMTKAGKQAAWDFLRKRRCLYVLDETSGAIKTPKTKRTKAVVASGKYASFRRILDGTPITQGPFDVYAPVRFLDADFWKNHGFGSFLDFKQHFGVWRKKVNREQGREFQQLVAYRRLDELQRLLEPISTRVLKKDVLDLPEKLYSKRYIELTPEQQRMYDELRDQYMAYTTQWVTCVGCGGKGQAVNAETNELEECQGCYGKGQMLDTVTAELAITRALRLQQVICGYVPTDHATDEPIMQIPGGNPRLDAALEYIQEGRSKTIVWARFQLDIDLLSARLRKEGISAVVYDGRTKSDDRDWAKWRFQGHKPVMENGQRVDWEELPDSEQAQVFIGNPAAAGAGLTLNRASHCFYYSNTFKLRERLQSEDRAHRIGTKNAVDYCDAVALGTIDEKIVQSLRMKQDVASKILGDDIKEWI